MSKTFFGVIHLPALPGSPQEQLSLDEILQRVRHDAKVLQAGGADGVIVENFGDAPFAAGRVQAETVAMLTVCALEVRRVAPKLRLGINVLRNDALSALGISKAVDADCIRINVHVGAMVTDQGVIEGRARETLLERRRLFGAGGPKILADVAVKHAVPLGDWKLADLAKDTALRGLADVLIVTGAGTGQSTSFADVEVVKQAGGKPVWVGSGLTPSTAHGAFDGAIVGTYLHEGADLRAPLLLERVQQIRLALDHQS